MPCTSLGGNGHGCKSGYLFLQGAPVPAKLLRLHRHRLVAPGEPLHPAIRSVFAGVEDMAPGTESRSPDPLEALALAGTRAGRGTLQGAGFTARHRPRTVMVMRPQAGFTDVAGADVWRTHWLIMRGPLADAWLAEVSFDPPSVALDGLPTEVTGALYEACQFAIEGRPGWQWAFLARVSRVLAAARGELVESGAAATGLVQRARALMSRNLDHPLSLPEMAEDLNVSESALSHRFREETGVPPVRAQRDMRIARAREILAGGATVTETSVLLGFANPYHFSRLFKQTVGVPPARFRDENLSRPLRESRGPRAKGERRRRR